MPEPTRILALLLPTTAAQAIATHGALGLTGTVLPAEAVAALTEPAEMLAAFAREDDPRFVDGGAVHVLRFPEDQLMTVTPQGVVQEGVPARGWLDYTRVSVGASVWRLTAGAEPAAVAGYQSLAEGWGGSVGYQPPLGLAGPRAVWHGHELPASVTGGVDGPEQVELVAFEPLDGMRVVRDGVWSAVVPLSDVESVFTVTLMVQWRDTPARLLEVRGSTALLLLPADPAVATPVGGVETEPGVWQVSAPVSELREASGVRAYRK